MFSWIGWEITGWWFHPDIPIFAKPYWRDWFTSFLLLLIVSVFLFIHPVHIFHLKLGWGFCNLSHFPLCKVIRACAVSLTDSTKCLRKWYLIITSKSPSLSPLISPFYHLKNLPTVTFFHLFNPQIIHIQNSHLLKAACLLHNSAQFIITPYG